MNHDARASGCLGGPRSLEAAARAELARLEPRLAHVGKAIEDAVSLYLTGKDTPDFNELLRRYKELHERVQEARARAKMPATVTAAPRR